MHYFILIYVNNKPLHVSSRLVAHHQEDHLFVNSNWYSHASASCWFMLYADRTFSGFSGF